MTEFSEIETKRFLDSYKLAERNIESLIAEKERIESQVYSITASTGGEGGGGNSAIGDKMAEGIARLCDISERIPQEIEEWERARAEVRRVVNRVSQVNDIWGQCLHYRYIDGKGAVNTAHDMGYSESNERYIHRNALRCAWRYM
ncbi:hypothetical protein [Senegalimassilia anaerobia]